MEIHIKIIGVLLIFLGFIHIFFPKYFQWKKELQLLSLINRQMMYVHTFFLCLTIIFMGIICIFFTKEMMHTEFGKIISAGLGIFWLIRLFFQLFIYSSELWKGKAFETSIHIAFTLLWAYLSFIFLYVKFG